MFGGKFLFLKANNGSANAKNCLGNGHIKTTWIATEKIECLILMASDSHS